MKYYHSSVIFHVINKMSILFVFLHIETLWSSLLFFARLFRLMVPDTFYPPKIFSRLMIYESTVIKCIFTVFHSVK